MSEKGSHLDVSVKDKSSNKSESDVEDVSPAPARDSAEDLADLALSLDESTEKSSPEKVTLRIADDEPPPYHADAPPPYRPGSFRKNIQDAKEQSSGNVDFARRVFFGICCGTICCGIIIALNLAIPIVMIAIGSYHLKGCPRQKYIPIYLIVGGCFGVARAVITIVEQVIKYRRTRNSRSNQQPQKPNPADGVVSCFLFAWFITGCYWIYSIHGDYQSVSSELPDYCHEVLYQFAFWLTTTAFILMGIGLLLCCVMCIGMCVVAKAATS